MRRVSSGGMKYAATASGGAVPKVPTRPAYQRRSPTSELTNAATTTSRHALDSPRLRRITTTAHTIAPTPVIACSAVNVEWAAGSPHSASALTQSSTKSTANKPNRSLPPEILTRTVPLLLSGNSQLP